MSSKDNIVINVENVSFTYPDGTVALVDVDLEIYDREFVAFIGQNGSGKTTLAKLIAGLLKPTKGRVLVYGMDTRKASIHQLATHVGYVFQNPDHQLFNMTVYDEVAFGPRNLMLPEEEVRKRVMESIKIVGLSEEYLSESPFFLPKGLRQRVAIASILALRPKTIIVDEPTTGQDFKQSIEIMDFLKHLNKLGHTIIIITHEMEIVARYADRTVVLANGKKILDEPTRTAFTRTDVLAKAFVKPPQITRLAQSLADLGFRRDILTVDEMIEDTKRILEKSRKYRRR